jgi:hypothetical protein
MAVVQISGCGIGAAKVLQIESDADEVLVHLISSDSSGGFIHLTKQGARAAIVALKAAIA